MSKKTVMPFGDDGEDQLMEEVRSGTEFTQLQTRVSGI
jgi:hypothetical protein